MTAGGQAASDALKAAVHDLYGWRGTVIGGLAQIETSLLDICLRSNSHPSYTGMLKSYPWKASETISHVKTLIAAPGPMHQFQAGLTQLIFEYELIQKDRNLVTHSAMTMEHHSGEPLTLVMDLWYKKDKSTALRRTERWHWSELKDYADKVADLGDRFMALIGAIHSAVHFPMVTTFTPKPSPLPNAGN